MNVFFQELRQNRNATIIWIITLISISALYISIYPSVSQNANIDEVLKNMPEAFKKSFGISDDFLSAFPSLYAMVLNLVLLTGAVQAMNLGTGITSKEVRNKTADFLLTRPISRSSIMRQKLLAVCTLILMTNMFFLVAAWCLIQVFVDDQFPFVTFLKSSFTLVLIQTFFAAFGFMLGSVLPKVKSVIAVSMPVVFGFYMFGLLDTVIGVDKIKYMTPFKFFNVSSLAAGGGYESAMLVYLAVLVIGTVVASFLIYQNKDIHTI